MAMSRSESKKIVCLNKNRASSARFSYDTGAPVLFWLEADSKDDFRICWALRAARLWPLNTACSLNVSGRFSVAALVKFATVEAVVDHNAFVVRRTAPAIGERMLAQIIDGPHMVADHFPSHIGRGIAAHRFGPLGRSFDIQQNAVAFHHKLRLVGSRKEVFLLRFRKKKKEQSAFDSALPRNVRLRRIRYAPGGRSPEARRFCLLRR